MRGIGNKLKHKSLFRYFKDKLLDVVFLQETHSCQKLTKLWQNEWGSSWVISSYKSNARGVAILFNPKLHYKIISKHNDADGHFVICTIELVENQKHFTLCNIYAPNEDSPTFFP